MDLNNRIYPNNRLFEPITRSVSTKALTFQAGRHRVPKMEFYATVSTAVIDFKSEVARYAKRDRIFCAQLGS